ncbi:ABC transporter permease subunit [Dongia rigui]|uniref:ABC transporter permease subunit n=1 Tax=Dongia rigui TaxID=940149 RepID=A0ABU5E0H3_9PROT|nr:ABC transporter permease subunit [Dongia rigui]MDY0873030.1 ABC transporter permease subunit [Dongia rigui]
MAAGGSSLALRGPLAGLAWTSLGLQIAIFAAPLALVLWLSLLATANQSGDLSLTGWTSLLASPEAREALFSSILLAALTALGATCLSWPIAYLIAIRGRRLGRVLLGFVILLWFFDPGMRILGWMQAFKDLALLDILPLSMLSGFSAELIAGIHAWLPLSILVLALAFRRVDPHLLRAARECGADSATLLTRILWPLCRSAAALSAAITFSGAIGSFLEPRLLGTGEFEQASEWLQRALESETGWPYAAAMLILLLAFAAAPLVLLAVLNQRKVPT